MTLIPELEQELTRALTRAIPAPRRSRWWGLPTLAPVAVIVAGSAAALAATGVITLGSPEGAPRTRQRIAADAADSGLGTVRSGSAELLALRVEDPGSTLPWGMRVVRTSRGLGCVSAGLVLDGQLGALGIDGDFADDGRFHPFPIANTPKPIGCAPFDAHGRLFISVSEADVPTSASTLHRCPSAGSAGSTAPSDLCAGMNTRDIYYGLLGPLATSLSYTSGGETHTILPQGQQGAYLFILPATPHDLNGVSTGPLPSGPTITQVTYRGGLTCRFASPDPGSKCATPPGARWTRLDLQRMLSASTLLSPGSSASTSVKSTVTHNAHAAWNITVGFNAPVAITDARTAYTIELLKPGNPRSSGATRTDANLRRGQRVEVTFSNLTRTGPYTGTVRLSGTPSNPLLLTRGGPLVGRFTARIPEVAPR
jgi:hypothetical protein